jgi:hypothetical protein
MESTETRLENIDDFTQAIDSARAIKSKYVNDRLAWYKTHKLTPRMLYRLDSRDSDRDSQRHASRAHRRSVCQ